MFLRVWECACRGWRWICCGKWAWTRGTGTRSTRRDDGYGPVVVLGAGDLGTLFLDHLKSSAHDAYPGMRVLGFIDETRVLHGRRLRSFRILGGLSLVPKLVAEQGLKGIVLAINHPRKELLAELDALAEQYDLKIYRWRSVGWRS